MRESENTHNMEYTKNTDSHDNDESSDHVNESKDDVMSTSTDITTPRTLQSACHTSDFLLLVKREKYLTFHDQLGMILIAEIQSKCVRSEHMSQQTCALRHVQTHAQDI